jgi:hypothetical protein
MPKQKGTHRIKGSMGELTYYKDQDGFKVKEKSEIEKSRIQNDPNFELTRQNGAEFGQAAKSGKLIRMAFRTLLLNTADSRVTSRMTQLAKTVLNTDTTSARGARIVTKGNLELLEGFEFNIKSPLSTCFVAVYSIAADRAAGTLTVSIPSFVPVNKIVSPTGATHCRIVAGGAAIDFVNSTIDSDDKEVYAEIKLDATATQAITLQHTVTANTTLPLFVALGIEFFQELNGTLNPMKNGGFNSLTLVKVVK